MFYKIVCILNVINVSHIENSPYHVTEYLRWRSYYLYHTGIPHYTARLTSFIFSFRLLPDESLSIFK